MPSRHVRSYRARYDCLGSDPPPLLIAPPPTANYARYFRTAPNNVRVVTNVDHNVHTRSRCPLLRNYWPGPYAGEVPLEQDLCP